MFKVCKKTDDTTKNTFYIRKMDGRFTLSEIILIVFGHHFFESSISPALLDEISNVISVISVEWRGLSESGVRIFIF